MVDIDKQQQKQKEIIVKQHTENTRCDNRRLFISRGAHQIAGTALKCTIVCSLLISAVLCINATSLAATFEAPYDGCYSWGGIVGIADTSTMCNHLGGAIYVDASAFAGGSTAEVLLEEWFYLGTRKQLQFEGTVHSVGGKVIIPPAGVAGTEITCLVDRDPDMYWRSDIDSPFDLEWFTGVVLYFVYLITGTQFQDLPAAIALLQSITDAALLLDGMAGLTDVDTSVITGSAWLDPGWHQVGVGLRANSSGAVIGMGHAVRLGLVANISIVGIDPPNAPTVTNPGEGCIGATYEITASATDPNGDQLRYRVDWGDGDVSNWKV